MANVAYEQCLLMNMMKQHKKGRERGRERAGTGAIRAGYANTMNLRGQREREREKESERADCIYEHKKLAPAHLPHLHTQSNSFTVVLVGTLFLSLSHTR